jgi:hypothetical protein
VAAVITLVDTGRIKAQNRWSPAVCARGSPMPSTTPSASTPVPSPPTKPALAAYAQKVFSLRLSQRP